jgi:hypothetical protein
LRVGSHGTKYIPLVRSVFCLIDQTENCKFQGLTLVLLPMATASMPQRKRRYSLGLEGSGASRF